MMLRHRQRSLNLLLAFMACVAVLVFSFASPGDHAPSLHLADTQSASVGHSHDHIGHSHDDWDLEASDSEGSGHHHADHSHEKIDLAAPMAVSIRAADRPGYLVGQSRLVGGLPFGIDRPPRSVTSI